MRQWRSVEPAIARRFPGFTLHHSQAAGELRRIAADLARLGEPALVIAAGGDGTSHEVINGLVGDGSAVSPNVRLAWLALGSGNDMARSAGFGTTAAESVAALASFAPATIDVGLIRCRADDGPPKVVAFGNSFTVGVTTDVLRIVGQSGKRLGGRLAYAAAAVRALATHEPGQLDLIEDGRRESGPMWLVAITNGVTIGAGMRVAPGARIDDGWLDVLRVTGRSRLRLLSVFPRVYWGGHLTHAGVRSTRARSIEIAAAGPLDFEADGELDRGEPPFRITILPGALPIARPTHPARFACLTGAIDSGR